MTNLKLLNNLFIFFCLLIPYTVNSKQQIDIDYTKQVIEQINQINQSTPKECQHCLQFSETEEKSKKEQNSDLLQQCAVDLCGPAKESFIYVFNNNTFDNEDIDPEIVKHFDKMIRPTIEEFFLKKREHNKDILSSLQDKLANPESNIKPQEWDEVAEALSMKIAMDNAAAAMSIDAVYTSNDISINYPSEIASNGDTSYKENKAKMMPFSVGAALLNLSSPSIERQRELLREQYQNFLEDYQINEVKLTKKDKRTIAQLGKHLERKDLNSLAFATSLDRLVKKSKGLIFCVEDCKKWVLSELSSLHQGLQEATSDDGYIKQLTQQLNYCQSVYNTIIQGVQRMNMYEQNLNQYVGQFLIKTFNNYSAFSRQSYKNYMNNVLKVAFPSSLQNVEQKFVESIRRTKNVRIASYSNNKIADMILHQRGESSLCLSPMMVASDSFSPEGNMVAVSHFSCHFHDHGKQILAHELAHALSHWFSTNKKKFNKPNKPSKISYRQYMKLRRCANRRYKTKNKAKIKNPFRSIRHRNDKFRTEEDMADLIAYQVFHENPTLFQCSSLSSSTDGSKYAQLHILPPPHPKGVQVMPDTHSPPLLRAITEAIHKRKPLSTACQQVVNLYNDKINFEPCF
ncbi:MAG: hypothetical protein OXM55_06410 [Bdellovibrionales bacterium]|nr:hypothetical protein [Bdellovibrionales bacterium]